jgi:hypothetical protein
MLKKKTSREEVEECEDYLSGRCTRGKKCEKVHKKLTEGEKLLALADQKLLMQLQEEVVDNSNRKYFLRKRVKKTVPVINSNIKDDRKKKSKKKKRGPKVAKAPKIPKIPKIACSAKSKQPKPAKKPKTNKNKTFSIMTSRTKIEDKDCQDFLTSQCTKTFCDKLHNFSLKFKDQNNEEFSRRFTLINQDFSVLEPFQRRLYGDSVLDLMFLVDCTGSMSSWIDTVKTELKKIITYIKENNPYSRVRISFVGYRDFDMSEEKRFSILNFTEDADEAKKYISEVVATGGADIPEDVAGGLKKGLEQNWQENSAKYCILVCDAPCHGTKYHTQSDTYPQGCPNGLIPEDLVAGYAMKNITFYAVKINYDTNTMYDIFSRKYQEVSVGNQPIVIADLGRSTEKFAFLVAVAANTTLSSLTVNNISLREFLNVLKSDAHSMSEMNVEYQTKLNNFVKRVNTLIVEEDGDNNHINTSEQGEENKISSKTELDLVINVNKSPDFNNLPNKVTLNTICHSYVIKKDRHLNINWKNPFIQHTELKSKVTISQLPFSEGSNRYAFYMKDESLNQELVGKLPKILDSKEYNIEGLRKDLEAITICNYICGDFNNRIVNLVPDTRLLLNFINCYIYEIQRDNMGNIGTNNLSQSHPYKYYTAENYIKGEYVKYNNNAGWISQNVTDQVLLAQAFSHFSWQITKGYLCVVDLQGVGGFLTDPQIHCLDHKKFGNGNFGYIGMVKFFMSHTCNSYCKKLELVHPRKSIKIDKDYNFFVDKFISPDMPDLLVYKLCDLCKKPYQKKAIDLYELKKKCWEGFCDNCDDNRKKNFQGGKCSICMKFFKSSAYVYKMRRQSFPDKCQKCTQDHRIKLRDDYYKDYIDEENFESEVTGENIIGEC